MLTRCTALFTGKYFEYYVTEFRNIFKGQNSKIAYLYSIGVGMFRILGGQGLEYWGGGQGGAKFPAAT